MLEIAKQKTDDVNLFIKDLSANGESFAYSQNKTVRADCIENYLWSSNKRYRQDGISKSIADLVTRRYFGKDIEKDFLTKKAHDFFYDLRSKKISHPISNDELSIQLENAVNAALEALLFTNNYKPC